MHEGELFGLHVQETVFRDREEGTGSGARGTRGEKRKRERHLRQGSKS